jgi:hypothetical protein
MEIIKSAADKFLSDYKRAAEFKYIDIQSATSYLLARDIGEIYFYGDPARVYLCVRCSDTFGYACADSEDIESENELVDLMHWIQLYPKDGDVVWVAKKRCQLPIPPVLEKMDPKAREEIRTLITPMEEETKKLI